MADGVADGSITTVVLLDGSITTLLDGVAEAAIEIGTELDSTGGRMLLDVAETEELALCGKQEMSFHSTINPSIRSID